MTAIFGGETPLARRFAAALANADIGRSRIRLENYTAAFLAAEPSLATTPERRARLAAAIDELVKSDVIVASRTLDRSETPHLPQFIVLLQRTADARVGLESAAYPWRPELAWAARLPLRRSEFEALKQVQVFLRDRSEHGRIVPAAERSLQLFGDEKRLDALRHNRRLFRPGRLSFDLLRARAYAPPFAFHHVGGGSVALVLENVATYHSVIAALPADSPVGLVIFGAGGNFAASVLYLAELPFAEQIRDIRYFGDLDRRGLEVPIAATEIAEREGLPEVRPAVGLWAKLLRVGCRASHPCIEANLADRLTAWLPLALRPAAREVLCGGRRLAQEAVGTELLMQDTSWATWAGLGPPGVGRAGDPEPELRRPPTVAVRPFAVPTGEAALLTDDMGGRQEPTDAAGWAYWVAASHTRNWVIGDPLLDWLRLYGRTAGYLRDEDQPGYDARTDFRRFVLDKGIAFEAGVLRLLSSRTDLVTVAQRPEDAMSLEKATATVAALRSGVGAVAQAVIRNPNRQVYGVADLLVRSDLLASWFPELLSWEDASRGAPGLGHSNFHYRAVDIKFHTFELTADGHVSGSSMQLAYGAQVLLYSEALGRVQGYEPESAYLIGRTWRQGMHVGEGCLERLARVDCDRWLPHRQVSLREVVQEAVAWIQRLRSFGSHWYVLPEPSVPELYPHARNTEDAPWHISKRAIAHALQELTLLPGMNPRRRAVALASGIKRWDHPDLSAERLAIETETLAARANAVIAANRASIPSVTPHRIEKANRDWIDARRVEFYVDFETVSNVDDDFDGLPKIGGRAQIVQIGCGHIDSAGTWCFGQWTVASLTMIEERRIIDSWIAQMANVLTACHGNFDDARIFHWSAAEPVNLDLAYNSARKRHPLATWPSDLPWFDLLEQLIRAEPVAVTGAFNFGLKSIAKGMHAAGFISTVWTDGPTDGLGAMAGVWNAARETATLEQSLSDHPLMLELAHYNQIDCRVMADILAWLRTNRSGRSDSSSTVPIASSSPI